MTQKFTLAELRESSYNPRTIQREALEGLQNSMELFGDISGLTFNVRTKQLIAGHARRAVLKALEPNAPVYKITDVKDEVGTVGYGYIEALGTQWNVRFVNWDEITEKAANLAANNLAISGEFTSAAESLLQEMSSTEFSDMLRLSEITWTEHHASDDNPDPIFSDDDSERGDNPSPEPLKSTVKFTFGDVKSNVSRAFYDRFKATYSKLFAESDSPLAEDVLQKMMILEEPEDG